MKNGIYALFFETDGNSFGHGILVVEDGLANGADSTYTYNGKFEESRLILGLNRYNFSVNSYFGNLGFIKVNLNFQEDDLGYVLTGNIENLQTIPLKVQAKFIGDIV
ncbi:GrlR family regulatory protein [Acinetobacter haemolyticus]|uniref:GrlR family regulatory protein n=1 Tax=Acinetobacter haemolyticus TaxID=29430 RepID=UPI003D227924